jgi:uncharacterized protein (TIGR02246 family)
VRSCLTSRVLYHRFMEVTELVDRQIAAYNSRDAKTFADCHAEGCGIEDGEGNTLMSGRIEIFAAYERFFARNEDIHAEVRNRIVLGNYVVDDEYVTGLGAEDGGPTLHAAAIYRVGSMYIDHVRLLLP